MGRDKGRTNTNAYRNHCSMSTHPYGTLVSGEFPQRLATGRFIDVPHSHSTVLLVAGRENISIEKTQSRKS